MESVLKERIKKSRIPAKLDFYQSATGLILGLFMWAHMCLVASILFGKDAFYWIAKTLEASFLSSSGHEGYPILVSIAAISIFTIFIIHAALAVRKFPINWQQYKILRNQIEITDHEDTKLWYTQFITGFIMFFVGSVHLYVIMTHPEIGPYASADRIISDWMWPLYLVLLISVELHGTIGLYRLVMKWGWFNGKDPKANRRRMKTIKKRLSIAFIVLGILSLVVFAKIGIDHKDNVGERYVPTCAVIK